MKKKTVHYLGKNEFTRLVNQISDERDKLILLVLYETGCTVNEVVHIKLNEMDFTKRHIRFPAESTKAGKSKISSISLDLVNKLQKFTHNFTTTYLFSTRQSGMITTKRVRQLIQSYSKKAGLGKVNPQIIRYTHVARALEKGIPLLAIQKQLGMERLRLVQIYEALDTQVEEGAYERFWSDE